MIQEIIEYIDRSFFGEQIWYNLSSRSNEAKNISKFIFEQVTSDLLTPIIIGEGWLDIQDQDRLIYLITKWVKTNIKYVGDIDNYKTVEYWASVKEILEKMSDDCEGGATLIVALGRQCGIPKEQLKLWCGDVQSSPTAPLGGHACALYKSKAYPYVWFFMDWCYYPILKVPGKSRPAYVFDNYLNVDLPKPSKYINSWFIVDEEKATRRMIG